MVDLMDLGYVLSQIEKIGSDGDHNPKIKLQSEHGETKWIDIDWESIRKIKAVLKLEN